MSHVDAKVDVEELLDSTEQLESTLKMKILHGALFLEPSTVSFLAWQAILGKITVRRCAKMAVNVGEQTKA